MKKLHLLCNAHLDPAWLWCRDEGIAEAISTFRVAADFCERYDGFVFCHNEALLYEWVEERDPELFLRIKNLVKQKKWAIMGGWYLQPDCVMTSGESLLSQIRLGREYFEEKFGERPTTAINFDPFGHTRGLVQILSKTGFDSYIFMRPYSFGGDFIWEGFDGSKIKAHGIYGGYNTLKGHAAEKVQKCLEKGKGLCLWGIGDHGGGPSEIDLRNINAMISESEREVVHSTAEAYMADVETDGLKTVSTSLSPCMAGCYTSMARIKQANRRLENKISVTEKMMAYADISDTDELKKAKKALAFCQFHDILPGSGIRPVEEEGLRIFSYGEEIADGIASRAFFKLSSGKKKARNGEIPIMAFNPHPYAIEGEFTVEFMLQDQNWNEDEVTIAEVFTEDGTALPTQNEKPYCTFNLDWIQRVCFKGTLAPASVTRFDAKLAVVKKDTLDKKEYPDESICVENNRMKVSISRKTGLIERFKIDGKDLIKNGGAIEVFRDNEDPWGMTVNSFNDKEGSFTLMNDRDANAFTGYSDENMPNVRVIEDGDVRIKVQAFFEYGRSSAVVEYTLPKKGAYIDVDILMYSNEPNKMIKYRIDTALSGVPYGETAFGEEELFSDGREAVYHKWCGIRGEDRGVFVLNKGTYGGDFSEKTIRLSLLRTPIYAAHPIEKRTIAPRNRFTEHIDMGERRFSFRIVPDGDIARQAQYFNEEPRLMSFFPSGEGENTGVAVEIDDPCVIMTSYRKHGEGYRMTLFNSSSDEREAKIIFPRTEKTLDIRLGKYEIKFVDVE